MNKMGRRNCTLRGKGKKTDRPIYRQTGWQADKQWRDRETDRQDCS
jgi:hypothetical protein